MTDTENSDEAEEARSPVAMVEHDVGASIASQFAKRVVLYARRPGYQTQFSALLRAQVQADDHFADLIAWIQENLEQPLDVPILAERVKLTERSRPHLVAQIAGRIRRSQRRQG